MIPLQAGLTMDEPIRLAAALLGVGVAAAAAAGGVAAGYRWYVRERVPSGLGMLFGLTVVAAYLGTTGALGEVVVGQDDVLATSRVLPNLAAFAVGATGAAVGTRTGDRLGTDIFAATGGRNVDADVSEIVQTVGRVTSVHLPEEIDDVVGYDPVPDETKAKLAGRRFLFPRRLTESELRERLVSRLRTDYGVGHVDLELAADGTVTYLAVGSRAAGIGPTLPPATNAVPIRADPAHAASSGDLVQVWSTEPLQRVLTGELRGVAGEVVTVAIDAADTPKLDPTEEYRLVTLPVQDRPDREFAALLRAADETMSTVTVEPGSDLVGRRVADLGVTVAAVTTEDGEPETIPPHDRVLAAGEVVYAIATPDAIRRVEEAAAGGDPTTADRAEPGSSADADDESGGEGGDGEVPPAEGEDEPPGADDGPRTGDGPGDERPDDGTPEGIAGDGRTDDRRQADSTGPDEDDPDRSEDAAGDTDRPDDRAPGSPGDDRRSGSDDGDVEVWDPAERVEAPDSPTDDDGGSAEPDDEGTGIDDGQTDGDADATGRDADEADEQSGDASSGRN
ncbi:TrkA C-terminal domain-containing protein [Haloarcula litorea]|uniref:TrkA C-terminal domain-containing protein n=1 Tax=Haloarcula litorea TaxID=3032579 RepID=UPI0023E78FC2|nr:TrkA C-terminal domain-containing protein [Halomicroarcula sp. GDY20]